MAEARANLSLGGYDDKFVNKLDDDLICGICILPLNNPMLTRCGHRFCRVCLDGHLNRYSVLVIYLFLIVLLHEQ